MTATTHPFAASAAQVRLAKTRFLEDRIVPAGVVKEAVARSWERSVELGLRPRDKALFRSMPSAASARNIVEEARRLIDAAAPEVEHIAGALTQPNMIVLCTDAEGVIVHSCSHEATVPRELREPLRVGRSLVESEIGTTAPGCVLADRTTLVVNGEEHFLFEVGRFACAAAPIFQFDGSLAGVLDITGIDVVIDDLIADLVHIAARSSEHRLFASGAPGLHVRIHRDPRFLRTPLGGMIALGDDGRVVGACSSARRALRLGTDEHFVDDLVDVDHETLRRRLHNQDVVELRCQRGGAVYLTLDAPSTPRPPRASVSRSAPPPPSRASAFGGLRDAAVRAETERASLAFGRGVPVLITGETGTGKDVLARSLHESHRADGPFVAINCTAVSEGLAEAELFGFAFADHGTLFLEEIGDMDLRLQSRLLHFLQTRMEEIDCAIVCATHRDLEAMVAAGTFREDLFHRINGLSVHLPPLRDRTDFEELVDQFLLREAGSSGPRFSTEARAKLTNHGWRGNVRELEQVVRTAVALSEGCCEIGLEHLPPQLLRVAPEADESTGTLLERVTAGIARRVLAEHKGNVSAAARALGVSRGTMYKKTRARS